MISPLYLTALTIMFLAHLGSPAACAQSGRTSYTRGERLITALMMSKTVPGLYGDDGFEHVDLSIDVVRIYKLGKTSIPLLIRHLDDRRAFRHMMSYGDPNNPEKVTVGEGVLEILTNSIRQEAPFFDMACVNDENRVSEDPCISEHYSFGPNGKRAWQKAFKAGKVHYKKPDYFTRGF